MKINIKLVEWLLKIFTPIEDIVLIITSGVGRSKATCITIYIYILQSEAYWYAQSKTYQDFLSFGIVIGYSPNIFSSLNTEESQLLKLRNINLKLSVWTVANGLRAHGPLLLFQHMYIIREPYGIVVALVVELIEENSDYNEGGVACLHQYSYFYVIKLWYKKIEF